jgi:transketolase
MTVIVPSDNTETRQAVLKAAAWQGPVYLRLCRNETEDIFDKDHEFRLGASNLLRDGKDLTLVVTGILADRVLESADALAAEGIRCRVLQMSSIKPIDVSALERASEETGALVTVEEHNIIGGLGSAVAEVLTATRPAPLERVGIQDTFAESGDYDELLDKYGMSVADITAAARKVLARKENT